MGRPFTSLLWSSEKYLVSGRDYEVAPFEIFSSLPSLPHSSAPYSQTHQPIFFFLPASWCSDQSFGLLIMRSRVRFPVLPWGFFLEGEDSHGDDDLGSLVELRVRPLLLLHIHHITHITIHLTGTT
jgi:hypothetical protein